MIIANIDFAALSLWQANKVIRDGVFTKTECRALVNYYSARLNTAIALATILDGRDGFYKNQLREVSQLIAK